MITVLFKNRDESIRGKHTRHKWQLNLIWISRKSINCCICANFPIWINSMRMNDLIEFQMLSLIATNMQFYFRITLAILLSYLLLSEPFNCLAFDDQLSPDCIWVSSEQCSIRRIVFGVNVSRTCSLRERCQWSNSRFTTHFNLPVWTLK